MIVLRIDGAPKGKGRPRFNRATGRPFTPGDTTRAENRIQIAWLDAGRPRIDGPLKLSLEIVVERPKSHYRVDGTLNAAGERAPLPIRKPDVDNALKLGMDALNGCAYRDDVDVVSAAVVRRWARLGEHEHSVVRLWPAWVPDMPTLRALAA